MANPRPTASPALVDDGTFQCCTKIGRSYLLCGRKSSHFPYTFFVGPDWGCMLVTYSLIIVPSILFINNVAYHWGPGVIVVTVCLVVCTLGFYTMTACSDPGIVFIKVPSPDSDPSSRQAMARDASAEESEALQLVKRDSYDKREERRESEDGLIDGDVEMGTLPQEHSDDREGERRTSPAAGTSRSLPSPKASTNRIVVGQVASANRPAHNSNTHSTALALLGTPAAPYLPPPPLVECGRCQLDRPRDASHCHYCGVCVKQLDHHCPWTGKCIGEKTIRYFYAFLWSLLTLIVFVVAFVLIAAIRKYPLAEMRG